MVPVAILLMLAARWPEGAAPPRLDEFDAEVQRRFSDGRGFGMSRLLRFPTLGRHFRAPAGARTDFAPENEREREIIERWTRDGWQAGLYVFGAGIRDSGVEAHFHRALKGPGVLVEGTAREELPRWEEMYPVALRAMEAFERGRDFREETIGSWRVTARAVRAPDERCVECHNRGLARIERGRQFQAGDALGGALYLYRR